MTVHNLEGVELLTELGFTRVVVSESYPLMRLLIFVKIQRQKLKPLFMGLYVFPIQGNA